jgi:hypothetical protein
MGGPGWCQPSTAIPTRTGNNPLQSLTGRLKSVWYPALLLSGTFQQVCAARCGLRWMATSQGFKRWLFCLPNRREDGIGWANCRILARQTPRCIWKPSPGSIGNMPSLRSMELFKLAYELDGRTSRRRRLRPRLRRQPLARPSPLAEHSSVGVLTTRTPRFGRWGLDLIQVHIVRLEGVREFPIPGHERAVHASTALDTSGCIAL